VIEREEAVQAPSDSRSEETGVTSWQTMADGQRLLLRTGPANEAKIKERLRTIRGLLVGQHLQPAATGSATGAATSK